MKLIDLEPQFLTVALVTEEWERALPSGGMEKGSGRRQYHMDVDTFAEAQGVMFLCPRCFETNKGAVGTHQVLCWFAGHGVPDDATPAPGRWAASGSGYSDLTLTPSVLLTSGCGWHGFVTAGDVTTC